MDREKAPNSYLVLSWNDTGKYGTQPKDKDAPIEFRIPYGVYNVLNNNSIPVELSIVNEDEPSASAKTLSASDSDEDEGPKNSTVIIRPSMSREVILDVGQYLTISEDAKELIFFYVSEVPEELPSDTTGHAGASQAVVYAYVNGTEVRFRSKHRCDPGVSTESVTPGFDGADEGGVLVSSKGLHHATSFSFRSASAL